MVHRSTYGPRDDAGGREADDDLDSRASVVLGAHDTPAEVDAAFRTVRRVSVGYFVLFLGVIAGFPVLSLTLEWWSESRLVGNMSPGFAMAAFGLYIVFLVIAVAAARLSTAVEARMLGGGDDVDRDDDVPVRGDV